MVETKIVNVDRNAQSSSVSLELVCPNSAKNQCWHQVHSLKSDGISTDKVIVGRYTKDSETLQYDLTPYMGKKMRFDIGGYGGFKTFDIKVSPQESQPVCSSDGRLGSCPDGWKLTSSEGGKNWCEALAVANRGTCSAKSYFYDYTSDSEKAKWAASCDTKWTNFAKLDVNQVAPLDASACRKMQSGLPCMAGNKLGTCPDGWKLVASEADGKNWCEAGGTSNRGTCNARSYFYDRSDDEKRSWASGCGGMKWTNRAQLSIGQTAPMSSSECSAGGAKVLAASAPKCTSGLGTCPDGWQYVEKDGTKKYCQALDVNKNTSCNTRSYFVENESDDSKRSWSSSCNVRWTNHSDLSLGQIAATSSECK